MIPYPSSLTAQELDQFQRACEFKGLDAAEVVAFLIRDWAQLHNPVVFPENGWPGALAEPSDMEVPL